MPQLEPDSTYVDFEIDGNVEAIRIYKLLISQDKGHNFHQDLLKSKVYRVFGHGSLWGGTLCVYEFQHAGPSRSGEYVVSVVCPPEDPEVWKGPGELIRHVLVILAHHEGTECQTLEQFLKAQEEFAYRNGILELPDIVGAIQIMHTSEMVNKIVDKHYLKESK